MDLDSYYHNRILRWAGHVARMPMTRAPRQLLTGWVAHSRPNGCPEMTWGRTLKKALKCKGLPVNFKEWRAIAEDRSEWRSRTYSKPMPPSENWSYGVHESKDEYCIAQKDTQPSQTCSGGFIKIEEGTPIGRALLREWDMRVRKYNGSPWRRRIWNSRHEIHSEITTERTEIFRETSPAPS